MTKNKKLNITIYVIIAVLVVSALLPLFISFGKKDKMKDSVVITDTELNIVYHDIQFEQNAFSINLLSGEIITNKKIDNVFINVNGVGVQDLKYTQVLNADNFYVITLISTGSLLGTCFGDDTTVTADVYVEYAKRSHRVVSKDIAVKSVWTPYY